MGGKFEERKGWTCWCGFTNSQPWGGYSNSYCRCLTCKACAVGISSRRECPNHDNADGADRAG